jgi:hypothetical protein
VVCDIDEPTRELLYRTVDAADELTRQLDQTPRDAREQRELVFLARDLQDLAHRMRRVVD